MLGGGRRASTLRSRVCAMRHYVARLARNCEVAFPRELDHDAAFLKVRSSEPCTRGALHNVRTPCIFLDGMSGLLDEEKQTSTLVLGDVRQGPAAHGYGVHVTRNMYACPVLCRDGTGVLSLLPVVGWSFPYPPHLRLVLILWLAALSPRKRARRFSLGQMWSMLFPCEIQKMSFPSFCHVLHFRGAVNVLRFLVIMRPQEINVGNWAGQVLG